MTSADNGGTTPPPAASVVGETFLDHKKTYLEHVQQGFGTGERRRWGWFEHGRVLMVHVPQSYETFQLQRCESL